MPTRTLLASSLILLLPLAAQSVSASTFEAYLADKSVAAGGDITLRVSLPTGVVDRNTALTDDNATSPSNEFNIELYRLTNASGDRYVAGLVSNDTAYGINGNEGIGFGELDFHAPFIGTAPAAWPWSSQDYVIEDPDNNLTSGVYSIKLCLKPLSAAGDAGGLCNESVGKQEYYTSLIIKPAGTSTRKILLLDDYLNQVATSSFGNGSILINSNSKPVAHPIPEANSRYFLETAAWLERQGYNFDVMSSLDIESGIPDTYDVVIVAGENGVWTDLMREALTQFVADAGHSAMIISGRSQYYLGSVTNEALTITGKGDSGTVVLNFDQGGTASNKGYNVLAPDHWAFDGLDLTQNSIIGAPGTTVSNGVVGPYADGASFDPINSTTNRFAFGSSSYEVLAYAAVGTGYALPGMYRYNGTGGWVFNTASARWASGLTNRNNEYAIADSTVSQITKTILDTFLTGGPADADNDGIIDADDNCPNTANTAQTDSNQDGTGDACTQATVDETDTPSDTTDGNTDADTSDTQDDNAAQDGNTGDTSGGGGSPDGFLLLLGGLPIFRRYFKYLSQYY